MAISYFAMIPNTFHFKARFIAELCEMWLQQFSPECVREAWRPSSHTFLEGDILSPGCLTWNC